MEQCYPAYLTVASLNPLSQNKELALTYLSSLLEELPLQTRLYFWPEHVQPEERLGYQEEHQRATEEIARLQGLVNKDAADGADQLEIQASLADAKQWLEYLENEARWELSPETIRTYQSIANNVLIPGSTVREMLDEPMISMVKQYAAGQIDSATLLETIINKARMIQLEQSGSK
jgi:hypothetical protein